MSSMFNRVRQNWYAVMPEIAVKGQKGRAVVKFTIVRDGKVKDLQLVLSAGDQALDNAAQAAIKVSSPLPPLPEGFKGDQIVLQLSFLYNLKGADR
jgi:TonB family protein